MSMKRDVQVIYKGYTLDVAISGYPPYDAFGEEGIWLGATNISGLIEGSKVYDDIISLVSEAIIEGE